jgi:Rod binding domain-containing protein
MNPSLDIQMKADMAQSETQLQRLQRQYLNPTAEDQKKLKKVAQEFEAIFVQQVLDAMEQTVDRENSMLSGGYGEEMFRGMLNQEVAKSASMYDGRGFGLAETIYQQMSMAMTRHDQTSAQAVDTEG